MCVDVRGDGDGAVAEQLHDGAAVDALSQFVLGALQALADLKNALVQVDILPTQAERFTTAQVGAERDGVQCAQPVFACRLEETLGLVGCQRFDLPLLMSG